MDWVRSPACNQSLLHFFPAASGSTDQLNPVENGGRLKFFPELKFQLGQVRNDTCQEIRVPKV
jgi:hypothetical protein